MRVIMPAIIDQAGRQFNVDEADGVNRRHTRADDVEHPHQDRTQPTAQRRDGE
jgi:hypothetical protein